MPHSGPSDQNREKRRCQILARNTPGAGMLYSSRPSAIGYFVK